jgi:hypothetical protein
MVANQERIIYEKVSFMKEQINHIEKWLQPLMAVYIHDSKEGANTKDMMTTNTAFLDIKKLHSYYLCHKCVSKSAQQYVLITQENPESPTSIIPLYGICYQQHKNNGRREP